VKKIDSTSQREIVDSIERIAKECGYTWYKGQEPNEQINTLLTAFTELRLLKFGVVQKEPDPQPPAAAARLALPAPKRELI
jgi:hypothetical protein